MKMKFLTDAMLGRLTRLLRIFSYDTIYAEEVEPSAPDSTLLEYAIKHDRIILTKDLPFHKIAKDRSFYLKGTNTYENLLKLAKELNLSLDFSMKKARCSVCNSSLEKVKDKESIQNKVELETFKTFQDFYICLNVNCGKIYWRGSHIEKITNTLNEITKLNS